MTRTAALTSMLLAAILGGVLALGPPQAAFACSAGSDWDPAAESEVVIAGRVTDMALAPEVGGRGPTPEVQAVWLTFEVDRYLKAAGGTTLTAVDTSSVAFLDGQTPEQMARFEGAQYWGSGGACGALNEDPRGRYAVLGLMRLDDGTLRTNLLTTFAWGDGPDDPRILEGIARAEAAIAATPETTPAPRPAATGHGPGIAIRTADVSAPTSEQTWPARLGWSLAALGGAGVLAWCAIRLEGRSRSSVGHRFPRLYGNRDPNRTEHLLAGPRQRSLPRYARRP
ncbi:MAG: hypothetical protein WD734_01895 [Dehalococcoidia bacterium]